MKIEAIHIDDSRLKEFREQVMVENGGCIELVNSKLDLLDFKKYLAEKNINWNEELWKLSGFKWNSVEFEEIFGVIDDSDRIVSISGAKKYSNGMCRVGMHYYTLKNLRKIFPYPLFKENGFFARHLETASEQVNIHCLFLTIYPHNRTLDAIARSFSSKKLNPSGLALPYLKMLVPHPQTLRFHGVDQYFFLYPLDPGFQFTGQPPSWATRLNEC